MRHLPLLTMDLRNRQRWTYQKQQGDFIKNILKTPAVSSTNFGSILIFASCVVGTWYLFVIYYSCMGELAMLAIRNEGKTQKLQASTYYCC